MLLLDLITRVIIEDTNRKEFVATRAKALSVKANMVKDKPTPKRYEKKIYHKKKNNNKFSRHNGFNHAFKKKANIFVYGRSGHHVPQCRHRVKNDNSPKENIAKEEDTIVVVVSQVKLVTTMGKWVVDSGLSSTFVQTKMCFPPTQV